MAVSRYSFVKKIRNKKYYGTSQASSIIFNAVEQGSLSVAVSELKELQRLDHIAGKAYGNSDYWWVIAAASGIGWGLQVPPGTVIRIPKDLNKVISLL